MSHRTKRILALTAVALSMVSIPFVLAPGAQEAGKTAAVAAAAPATRAVPGDPLVELAKALGWPLIALIIALIFRRPLIAFMSALGTRVTKLSLFKVELELVPATSAAATPLLDDIRTATTSAPISDSSKMMLEQVQMGTPADYATIALGTGDEWLTSRLFIAAVMLERMRSVQVLVFVESTPATDRRFVAVAPVHTVRWTLAQRYPFLEAAWARAYLGLFPQDIPANSPPLPPQATWLPEPKTMTMLQPIITSSTGAIDPWSARQLVTRFIDSLQRPATGPPAPSPPDWVVLNAAVEERAAWVTREMLSGMLPPDTFLAWTDAFRDAPRAKRTRAVLRRAAPFVALTEGDREFIRLVNRKALLEEIATASGEEPERAGA